MHTAIILIAKYLIFASGLVVFLFFFSVPRAKKWQFIFDLIVGAAIVYGLAKLGSALFYNARPFVVEHFTPLIPHANDNGFPSDHTLLSSFFGFLIMRYSRGWGIFLLIFAAAIGAARVVAGVHHIEDIIGAFAIAGVGMLITFVISKLIFRNRTSAPYRSEGHHAQNIQGDN